MTFPKNPKTAGLPKDFTHYFLFVDWGIIMKRLSLTVYLLCCVFSSAIAADAIDSAMSAAPESISADAAVMDWNFNEIREGSNGWTCLPDRANTPGNDPWCVTNAWVEFLDAYVNKTEPTYTEIGFAYMLQGDTPVSNADPYETEATSPDDWVTDLGPHLMILNPDLTLLKNISTDHLNGGPWVMWPDTPYAHIMVPLESRGL
jgi:hypothetical protein